MTELFARANNQVTAQVKRNMIEAEQNLVVSKYPSADEFYEINVATSHRLCKKETFYTMQWVNPRKRTVLFQGMASGDQYGGPTKMAQLLYESIEVQQRLDVKHVTARYLDWWKRDAFDTGPVFDAVFRKIHNGPWRAAAAFQVDLELNGKTAGCNPAHRIAPIALYEFISLNALGSLARSEARITHWHPIAGDMSAIMAYLCRFLLEEQSWEDAKSKTAAIEPEAWEVIKQANISKDGYAPNVMRTAINFLDQPNSLERAFEFAGFGNYCPVIVGTLDALRNHLARTNNEGL